MLLKTLKIADLIDNNFSYSVFKDNTGIVNINNLIGENVTMNGRLIK